MTRSFFRLALFSLLSTIGSAQIIPVHGTGTAATIANSTGVFAPDANIAAVFNPSQVDGAGMPVDGAVGDNGSGTARVYHQIAAFNVATLLTTLGLGTDAAALGQLAGFTFTFSGNALDNPDVDLEDAFFYHAACIGTWQDDGTPPTDVPVTGAPIQNVGTPSATSHTSANWTRYHDAVQALRLGRAVFIKPLNLSDTAGIQPLSAPGFSLSWLASDLAADTDLTNNYVFFSFYMDPMPLTPLVSGVKSQLIGGVTLTALPAGGTPYQNWATLKGLDGSPGREAGFSDDPEGDSVPNGMEWILGGNPLAGDAGAILPDVSADAAGNLTLIFTRASDSVSTTQLSVQWDSDTANFPAHSTVIGSADTPASGDDPVIDIHAPSAGKVTVTLPAANAVSGRIFARLSARPLP